MGATKDKALEGARAVVAKLAAKVAQQALVALDVSDDQVKLDMACTAKEAPMRAHLLTKLAASSVKAHLAEGPVSDNSLNITIIGSAQNNEQWLAMARPFRQQIADAKDELDPDPAIPDGILEPVSPRR